MKNKIKIAILTSGRNKPLGTFIKNYIEFLPYDKIVLFGGFIPYFYEGTSTIKQSLFRYFFTLLAFKNESRLKKFIKNRLKKILISEKIDCVLAEFLNTGSSVREVCEELNIPIVVNVLGYEIHKKDVYDKYEDSYKKLANYKSIVIPVAKNMIPKLEKLGFKDNQIIFSPLGAREEFFKTTPNYKTKTFLAVGRFTASKSPESTITAFSKVLQKIPEAKLIFAGDGELMPSTKELAKKLKIDNAIDFVGWISQEKQQELLSISSVFVQHSVTTKEGDAEGTPVAILEAAAAGLPVVSTRHGGIVDSIIESKTGFLVDEFDVEKMAERMIYLLENPLILEKMGENARNFIYDHYSMKKHIEHVNSAINYLT